MAINKRYAIGREYGRKSYVSPKAGYDTVMSADTEADMQNQRKFAQSERKKGYLADSYDEMEHVFEGPPGFWPKFDWPNIDIPEPPPWHVDFPDPWPPIPALPPWQFKRPNLKVPQLPRLPRRPIRNMPLPEYPVNRPSDLPTLVFRCWEIDGYCPGMTKSVVFGSTYEVVAMKMDLPTGVTATWSRKIWYRITVTAAEGASGSIYLRPTLRVEYAPGKFSFGYPTCYIGTTDDCCGNMGATIGGLSTVAPDNTITLTIVNPDPAVGRYKFKVTSGGGILSNWNESAGTVDYKAPLQEGTAVVSLMNGYTVCATKTISITETITVTQYITPTPVAVINSPSFNPQDYPDTCIKWVTLFGTFLIVKANTPVSIGITMSPSVVVNIGDMRISPSTTGTSPPGQWASLLDVPAGWEFVSVNSIVDYGSPCNASWTFPDGSVQTVNHVYGFFPTPCEAKDMAAQKDDAAIIFTTNMGDQQWDCRLRQPDGHGGWVYQDTTITVAITHVMFDTSVPGVVYSSMVKAT